MSNTQTQNDLVFLDCETTGLDDRIHEVWEVAFAVNDEPIESYVVPHSLKTADPKALELNGYLNRYTLTERRAEYPGIDIELKRVLTGATIVAANPAFDAGFLRARWGIAPWHYRMVDVEAQAMLALDYDRPKGLKSIADDLRAEGYLIPEPDHTAAGDVATLREVFHALRLHVHFMRQGVALK